MKHLISAAAATAVLLAAHAAGAKEYFVGGPVHQHDMEIVANYLIGIEMAPMLPNMPHGADVIHLEADVHATADNVYGFPDGAWVPYLTIDYTIDKVGGGLHTQGTMHAMEANDGPHYADDVKMAGPGKYTVTYHFTAPEKAGFLRHVDKETGVPEWWKPFSQTFTFSYPQK